MKHVVLFLGALNLSLSGYAQDAPSLTKELGAPETDDECCSEAIDEAMDEAARLRTLLNIIMDIRPVLVAENTCPSGWEMSDVSPVIFDDRYRGAVLCKPKKNLLRYIPTGEGPRVADP